MPNSDRPPYRVPSLAEIRAAPSNGLTVASTFAGAGGSSTGWEMAGFRVVWANEFHPPAADTYAANHPGTMLDRRDIRRISAADIADAVGTPDVLDGSPPCQDFSMAGQRTRGWGRKRAHGDGTVQRSDDLFGQYIRLVGDLQPKVFVAENVKGLVTGAAKGQFKRIMAGLAGCGYRVRAKVLDAQWLGVPQRRKRVIIIGTRNDLDRDPQFPVPLPYRYSMLDACPWLDGGVQSRLGHADRITPVGSPAPTIHGNGHEGHGRWELVPGYGFDPDHGQVELDQPAPTIPAADSHLHRWQVRYSEIRLVYDDHNFHRGHVDRISDPASSICSVGIRGVGAGQALLDDGRDQRRLSIIEVKRLCAFPDDYELTGSYVEQWARLGNSVPPVMMAAVAGMVAPLLG